MTENIKENIVKLSRLISEAEEKAKENSEITDLTATQINYLETINELGNPSITELSLALKLKKPSVTVVVERLIQKGCVYKIQSDEDRRSLHLHLTDVGKQINKRHELAHQYLLEFFSSKLTVEELRKLNEIFDKIVK
jgi:DNA-binding MarR family transcriptional regulator